MRRIWGSVRSPILRGTNITSPPKCKLLSNKFFFFSEQHNFSKYLFASSAFSEEQLSNLNQLCRTEKNYTSPQKIAMNRVFQNALASSEWGLDRSRSVPTRGGAGPLSHILDPAPAMKRLVQSKACRTELCVWSVGPATRPHPNDEVSSHPPYKLLKRTARVSHQFTQLPLENKCWTIAQPPPLA